MPLVPCQRQLEISPGHRAPITGLQPVLHRPGPEAATENSDDPYGGDGEDRDGAHERGMFVDAVTGERGLDHLADNVADDVCRRDRRQAEQAASGHREREHPWFVTDPLT